jgi:hypothetical protein
LQSKISQMSERIKGQWVNTVKNIMNQ